MATQLSLTNESLQKSFTYLLNEPSSPFSSAEVVVQNPIRERSISNESLVTYGIEDVKKALQDALLESEERSKKLLERLAHEVEGLRREIMELRKIVIKPCRDTEILPPRAFNDLEAFLMFESSLQEDESKLRQFKEELTRMSQATGVRFVKAAWGKLLTDTLADQFSWRGTEKKKNVRSLTTTMAIRQVFLNDISRKEDEFIATTKTFFQFAKTRTKRRERKHNLKM